MSDFRKFERMLKAAANRRRLGILSYLKRKEEGTVGTLAEELRISFKATSKHLVVLYAAELLEREQSGLEMHYRLAAARHEIIETLLRFL